MALLTRLENGWCISLAFAGDSIENDFVALTVPDLLEQVQNWTRRVLPNTAAHASAPASETQAAADAATLDLSNAVKRQHLDELVAGFRKVLDTVDQNVVALRSDARVLVEDALQRFQADQARQAPGGEAPPPPPWQAREWRRAGAAGRLSQTSRGFMPPDSVLDCPAEGVTAYLLAVQELRASNPQTPADDLHTAGCRAMVEWLADATLPF